MREDWTFAYTREEVVEAAKKKAVWRWECKEMFEEKLQEEKLGTEDWDRRADLVSHREDLAEEYEQWVRLLESALDPINSVSRFETPDRDGMVLLTRDDINYFGLDE